MDIFDCPNIETWNKRREWVESELEKAETGHSYLAGEHSTVLFMDMQIAYCSGAWISAIVMSILLLIHT